MERLRKPTNKSRRSREHLTPAEVKKVIQFAGKVGRHCLRDSTMILVAYRHGLRVTELTALKWNQMDLKSAQFHVHRIKNGMDTTHPLYGPELRALRKLSAESSGSPYVFTSERGGPMVADTFRKLLARAGNMAELGLPIHPHMLRHSTGFKLANEGRDTRSIQHYLGHKSIQHTVRYTEMSPYRFKDFWRD